VVPSPMTVTERAMCNGEVWPAECKVPEYGSVVNGALFFRRLPSREAVVVEFSRVLLAHLRFRSLARDDGSWHPTSVDPGYHFVDEPAEDDVAGVRRRIEELIAVDLDHSHPLWRVHLIPVQQAGELPALLLRIHHCIGDGSSISVVFNGIARDADGKPAGATPLMQRLANELARRQQACILAKACRSVAAGADAVKSFLSNASMPYRPLETDTAFNRPRAERRRGTDFGGARHVVYVPPFSLAYVKACKGAARVSLNDVVLSAASGAVRRYCERRGDPAVSSGRRLRMRALIPIANPNAGGGSPEDQMANNFAFVSARLALSQTDPLERMRRTSAEMSRIKHSTKAPVSLWQTNRMAHCISKRARQKVARDLFSNHSLIFSNVPGPDIPVYIAGEQLEQVQAIFPNYLSQVILMSYNGRVHMNFVVDKTHIEDADSLADCYIAELRAIGEALGVPADPLDCSGGDAPAAAPDQGDAAPEALAVPAGPLACSGAGAPTAAPSQAEAAPEAPAAAEQPHAAPRRPEEVAEVREASLPQAEHPRC